MLGNMLANVNGSQTKVIKEYLHIVVNLILGPLNVRLDPAMRSRNIRYSDPMPNAFSHNHQPMISPMLPVRL